jgi:SAM-dependent methyltransferase
MGGDDTVGPATMPEPSSNPHAAAAGIPWWASFFDDLYARVGLTGGDPALIEQIVEFLIGALELEPGMTVLDQCCGIGRLSLPLAQRGMRVIGVDQSAEYVDRATHKAASGGLTCEFHCADAMEFVSPRPCDAAFNWFTSFGYLEDDEINLRMLQRAFESLAPGGRFVIDLINAAAVLADFRSMMVYPAQDRAGGIVVLTDNRADLPRGMVESAWTFIEPDGRRQTRRVSTRLMMPHELGRLLRRCGFVDIRMAGWIDGSPLSLNSRRCIALARKPDSDQKV